MYMCHLRPDQFPGLYVFPLTRSSCSPWLFLSPPLSRFPANVLRRRCKCVSVRRPPSKFAEKRNRFPSAPTSDSRPNIVPVRAKRFEFEFWVSPSEYRLCRVKMYVNCCGQLSPIMVVKCVANNF